MRSKDGMVNRQGKILLELLEETGWTIINGGVGRG